MLQFELSLALTNKQPALSTLPAAHFFHPLGSFLSLLPSQVCPDPSGRAKPRKNHGAPNPGWAGLSHLCSRQRWDVSRGEIFPKTNKSGLLKHLFHLVWAGKHIQSEGIPWIWVYPPAVPLVPQWKPKVKQKLWFFGGKEWVKYLHLGFRLTRKVTVYGFLAGKGGAVWIFMDILFRHKIF